MPSQTTTTHATPSTSSELPQIKSKSKIEADETPPRPRPQTQYPQLSSSLSPLALSPPSRLASTRISSLLPSSPLSLAQAAADHDDPSTSPPPLPPEPLNLKTKWLHKERTHSGVQDSWDKEELWAKQITKPGRAFKTITFDYFDRYRFWKAFVRNAIIFQLAGLEDVHYGFEVLESYRPRKLSYSRIRLIFEESNVVPRAVAPSSLPGSQYDFKEATPLAAALFLYGLVQAPNASWQRFAVAQNAVPSPQFPLTEQHLPKLLPKKSDVPQFPFTEQQPPKLLPVHEALVVEAEPHLPSVLTGLHDPNFGWQSLSAEQKKSEVPQLPFTEQHWPKVLPAHVAPTDDAAPQRPSLLIGRAVDEGEEVVELVEVRVEDVRLLVVVRTLVEVNGVELDVVDLVVRLVLELLTLLLDVTRRLLLDVDLTLLLLSRELLDDVIDHILVGYFHVESHIKEIRSAIWGGTKWLRKNYQAAEILPAKAVSAIPKSWAVPFLTVSNGTKVAKLMMQFSWKYLPIDNCKKEISLTCLPVAPQQFPNPEPTQLAKIRDLALFTACIKACIAGTHEFLGSNLLLEQSRNNLP
ncbi:hypothetical protein VTL71DRAFT_9500 [Oculimacula yallundae]|uniref:Uncharacterized protein n=1 Tax=Oculimacula yallundae TaxID=86028 RepID=A0ABR4BTT8_9HELO